MICRTLTIRLGASLVLLLSLIFIADAQIPPLERTINVTAADEPLGIFLKKVGTQAGCVFSYSPSVVSVDRKVTGNFHQQATREILETVFEGTVTLKQKGNYIIIGKAPANEIVVSGYLVDEASGERVKSASVYDPITLRSTTTDEFGYFQLKMKNTPEDYKLIIRKVDYNDTLMVSRTNPSNFQKFKVKLEPAVDSFTEGVSNQATKLWTWTKHSVAKVNIKNVNDTIHRTWQVSLVPFIGTNRKLSGNVTNDWSVNVLGGYSAGTEKAELGLLFNINTGPVKYAQVASIFNMNGGYVQGVQLTGITNINLDSTKAVHIAGVANITAKSMKGLQLAAVSNITGKQVNGVQLAAVANISGKEVRGVQVSALANIAPRVNGVQIGLFNITDSIKGVPIGFMSIVGKGYHTIELSTDEVLPLNFGFRTGVRHFYNILSAGVRAENADSVTWGFGYGLGTSPRLGKKIHLNLDLTSHQLNKGNVEALNLVSRFYAGIDVQLTKALALSAGPTLAFRVYDTEYNHHPETFWSFKPKIVYEELDATNNLGMQWWWGFRAGLRIL